MGLEAFQREAQGRNSLGGEGRADCSSSCRPAPASPRCEGRLPVPGGVRSAMPTAVPTEGLGSPPGHKERGQGSARPKLTGQPHVRPGLSRLVSLPRARGVKRYLAPEHNFTFSGQPSHTGNSCVPLLLAPASSDQLASPLGATLSPKAERCCLSSVYGKRNARLRFSGCAVCLPTGPLGA